jgi:hypothetical protein
MTTCKTLFVLLGVAASVWACSNDTDNDANGTGGAAATGGTHATGGSKATGGDSSTSAASASGGKSAGGTSAVSVGGTHASGGATSQAGGGASASGGVSAATGGVSAIGGATTAMGGVTSAAGGSVAATGGAPVATGGVSAATGGVAAETGGTTTVPADDGGFDGGTESDGGTPQTLGEQCDAICSVASGSAGLECGGAQIDTTACVSSCKAYASDTSNDEYAVAYYEAMISCVGQHLTTLSDYQCSTQAANPWTTVENTVCENDVCNWTCYEVNYGFAWADYATYSRCGC